MVQVPEVGGGVPGAVQFRRPAVNNFREPAVNSFRGPAVNNFRGPAVNTLKSTIVCLKLVHRRRKRIRQYFEKHRFVPNTASPRALKSDEKMIREVPLCT